MANKLNVHRRARSRLMREDRPHPANATPAVTLVAGKMRITCNCPVVVKGVPASFKSIAASPTAVTVVNATTFDLTFQTPPIAQGAWTINEADPMVRTQSGGYVAGATGTF